MKKMILLCSVVLFFKFNSIAQQSTYQDALFIKNNCFDEQEKLFRNRLTLIELFKNYFPKIQVTTSNIDSILKSNVFLQDYVPDAWKQTEENPSYSKSFFSSVAGLDVTNIANGIAEFMIKRAKEELTVAFFERFKKFSEEHPEFRILFPKTADNLSNLLSFH